MDPSSKKAKFPHGVESPRPLGAAIPARCDIRRHFPLRAGPREPVMGPPARLFCDTPFFYACLDPSDAISFVVVMTRLDDMPCLALGEDVRGLGLSAIA